MKLTEAKLYANTLYAQLLQTASEIHCRDFRRIPLEFSTKLTTTGGYFQFRRTGEAIRIKISQTIMQLNDPKKFLDEVVPHEVAHYIVHEVYGTHVQPHGFEWKQVMRELGQKPNRTHSFKTQASNSFEYIVNGITIPVGPGRHANIQSGTKSYRVRGAGTIKASDWVDYKKERTAELPSVRPPRTTNKRKTFNGQSKATVARQLIRSWIRCGITKEQALARGELVTEMYHKAGMNNMGQARGYIRDQWERV